MLDCSDLDVGGEVQRTWTSHQKSHAALNPQSPEFPDNATEFD